MDWLDLLADQGTLKSLLQHHSSKASSPTLLCLPAPLLGSGLPLQLCPSVPQICRACARPRRHWGKAAWPAPSSACTCSRESCTLRRSGGGLGAGEGVRKGAGPKQGGPHSKLTPAGLAEAGPAVCPALPPTPRTRRTGPSGRPGHSG